MITDQQIKSAINTVTNGKARIELRDEGVRGAGRLCLIVRKVRERIVAEWYAMYSLGFFPAMDVVRQALPMVLAFLKMALVISIPLVLVFGTYDLKTVVTVSCVEFALFFVDFWFQLARWIDSTILDALYGSGFSWNRPHNNFDPVMGLNNAFGDMLLNFVMAMMFIVLPMFWVVALSWAGVRAGNILNSLTFATGDAKSAGGTGARLAMSAAKK